MVQGAVTFELAVDKQWKNGLDVGVAFGAHVYQFGDGTTLLTGETATVPPFGTVDPIVELGYVFSWAGLDLRPFYAAYLPLGAKEAFSAERGYRGEVGFSTLHRLGAFAWGGELSLLHRPVTRFSTARWGTQGKVAFAGQMQLENGLFFGPEIVLRPILVPQRQEGESRVLPAEALVNVGFENSYLQIHLGYGLGLPISRISSDIAHENDVRAPSTPVQHVFIDARFSLEPEEKEQTF